MRECNICERRGCDIVRLARKNRHVTDDEMQAAMSKSCSVAVLPKLWTQPIILTALATHPQGVHDVLREHSLFFQELKDKPFFRLVVRED